jgi:hypothetical protein
MTEGVHKLHGGSEERSLISCSTLSAIDTQTFRVPKMFGFDFLIPTRPHDFYRDCRKTLNEIFLDT